jgi:molecular chaperone GrpE
MPIDDLPIPDAEADEESEPAVYEISEEELSSYDDIIRQSIRELEAQDEAMQRNPPPRKPAPSPTDERAAAESASKSPVAESPPDGGPQRPDKGRPPRKKEPARPGLVAQLKRLKKDLASELLDTKDALQAARLRVSSLETEISQEMVKREDYAHLRSEFEGFRKRVHRQQDEFVAGATRELILRLLPVLDHAELAAKSLQQADPNCRRFVEGFAIILTDLKQVLKTQGLTEVPCKGAVFDPRVHEAMLAVHSDAYPENTVVEELRTGYLLGEKLLRPAMVSVAKRPKPAPTAEETDEETDELMPHSPGDVAGDSETSS